MKLSIVGCGAIAESFYLPALNNRQKDISSIIFIDRDIERAKYLANQSIIQSRFLNNYEEIITDIDAVIIATPPSSHFTIAKDFMENNVPVLVEKPLAETSVDIQSLIEICKQTKAKLMVNNTRRYFPVNQAVKKALVDKQIGEIKKITYYEGGEYNWPTVSGFYFSKESNAKGVLMDRGAHVVDLIAWWVDGKIAKGLF